MSVFARCTTYPIPTPILFEGREGTMRHIGPSVANNYLRLRFVLLLDTYFQYP